MIVIIKKLCLIVLIQRKGEEKEKWEKRFKERKIKIYEEL